jgi:phosphopantothenoylcysteine decarboxylase/phosphopantothenate--cysteine ligase
MAAAVADYRPKHVTAGKLPRHDTLTLELEATADIVAAASASKRPDQRTVGFSLEMDGELDRARQKMARKGLDLMIYNPTQTMNADTVSATFLYPGGRIEQLPCRDKTDFADILIQRVAALF